MLVATFPGSKTEVMADVRLITLAGGDPQAICLIAGTGSICWWEPFPGVVHRAGGWGPFVGDEGGGIWVVDQALRAICGAEDGREGPTKLKEEFLRQLGFRQVRELLPWREHSPRKQVAALSKIVLETANSGDPASKEICARGAGHLVNLVRSVLAREPQKIELSWPKIFAAGGMFSNRDYFTLIAEGIKTTCARLQITQVDEPCLGAFHHAQKWTNELPTS
jgi:N-acetylglucosamine kinase-like BadF-type ATPase